MTKDEIVEILESYKNIEDQRCENFSYHGYDYSPKCKQRKKAIDEAIKIISASDKREWIPYKAESEE